MFDIRSRVVFCDTIRQENNGKLLFVGTYLDDYVVPTLPFNSMGISIHFSVAFGVEARRLPSYVRFVVPGHSDDRLDLPFRDSIEQLVRDGRKEAALALFHQVTPFRISDRIDIEVRVGDEQDEQVVSRLHVRTAGEMMAAGGDKQLNWGAIELFSGYCVDVLPKLSEGLGDKGRLAAFEIFDSLCRGRAGLRLNDEDQPLWIVAGARKMWVLYTKLWHEAAELDLRRHGHPVKFHELERNAIGRLLELDRTEEFVDPSSHIITAKKSELVH